MYVDGDQVKVETDVNVTSQSRGMDNVTVEGGRDVIEACASRINASVQRVRRLDDILAERMTSTAVGDDDDDAATTRRRPLTVIEATADCPPARMTRAGFFYLRSGWQCPPQRVLDRRLWRCVSRLYPRRLLFCLRCKIIFKIYLKN